MSETTSTLPTAPKGAGTHGIGWIEIRADDLEASGIFYQEVFGWDVENFASDYKVFKVAAGGPNGGLRGKAPAATPACTPYIFVSDVALAQSEIAAAGGKKLTEPENLGGAWIGHFAAPNGVIYGLADTPVQQPHIPAPFGSGAKPGVNSLCSLEMYGGPDLPATGRFFGDLFGWASLDSMPGYRMFDAGVSVGGVFQGHTPSTTSIVYIYVADVAAKLQEIEGAGGKRMGEPMAMPGVTFGYFSDPSGTPMGLIGP